MTGDRRQRIRTFGRKKNTTIRRPPKKDSWAAVWKVSDSDDSPWMGSGNVWELDKSSDVFEKENRAPVSAQQLKPCVNSPAAPKASLSNQQSEWSFSEEVQKFETNSHAWAAETRHKGLSIGRESAVAKKSSVFGVRDVNANRLNRSRKSPAVNVQSKSNRRAISTVSTNENAALDSESANQISQSAEREDQSSSEMDDEPSVVMNDESSLDPSWRLSLTSANEISSFMDARANQISGLLERSDESSFKMVDESSLEPSWQPSPIVISKQQNNDWSFTDEVLKSSAEAAQQVTTRRSDTLSNSPSTQSILSEVEWSCFGAPNPSQTTTALHPPTTSAGRSDVRAHTPGESTEHPKQDTGITALKSGTGDCVGVDSQMGESAKTQADRPINAHTHVDAKTDLSHTSVDTHEVSSIVAHTPKTVDTRVRSPPQTMGTPPPAITLPPAHLKISSSRSLPSNSVDNRSSVGTVKTLDSDWLTDKMETDHWQLPDDFVVYDNKVKPTRARTSGSKQSAQHSTECATHDSVDPRENEPYTHMHTSATACDSSDVHVHIPTCDIPMHTSESAEHAHGTLQQAVESQEWVMEHSDAQTGCVREQERDADGSINRMQRSSSASLGTVLCTASLTGNGKNAHSCAKNSTRGSGSGSSRGSAKNRTHHDSGGSSGKPHPPTPKPHPTLRSLHSKVQPQPQPTRTDTQTPPTHSDTHTHPGTKLQQVFGDVARPGGVPMTRSHSRDQRVARRKGTRSKCEERTHNIAVPSLANSLSNRSQGSVVPNQSTSSLRMVGAPSASETRDGVQGLDCLPHIQRAGSSPTGSQIERTEHPAQPWVCASLHSSHHSLPAGRSGQSVNQAQYLRQPHSPPSSQHAPSHSAPWHTQGRVGQGSGSGGKSRTKTNSPHRCGHAGANTQPAKRTTELSLEGLDNTRLSPPHAPGRPKAKSSTPSASFVEWSPILPKNSSKRVHASDGATKPINDMPIMSTVARPVVRSAVTQPEPQTLIKPGLPMKKPRFPITATPSGVVVETPTVRATAVVDMTPMLKSLNISRDKVAHTSRNSSRNTSAVALRDLSANLSVSNRSHHPAHERRSHVSGTPRCVQSPRRLQSQLSLNTSILSSHTPAPRGRNGPETQDQVHRSYLSDVPLPLSANASRLVSTSPSICAAPVSFVDLLLAECGQMSVSSIVDAIGGEVALQSAKKIGEGSFAEVFLCDYKGVDCAVKIMPFGGVRAEAGDWKSARDVLQEVIMTATLNSHRHIAPNLIEVKGISVARGPFPDFLVQKWDDYNANTTSENERPVDFGAEQLFVVFIFANGGTDLENIALNSVFQAQSVIAQMAFSMAVTEDVLQFEHRDLHWGNVMVATTDVPNISYTIGGQTHTIATHGLMVNIIDFTLSRMRIGDKVLYFDLAGEQIFNGKGDSQFQVYRSIRKALEGQWERFCPYTNVLWLKYILDKLLKHQSFPRMKKDSPEDKVRACLRRVKAECLKLTSSLDVALLLNIHTGTQ